MRHPALRRSARHSARRGSRDGEPKSGSSADPSSGSPGASGASGYSPDPAGQNRPAPGVPPDGEHNQGGARAEGIDYQRDLGSEQDA
ncbi:MAG: hypothetical protein V4793_18310 [Paraburkholderia tropica]|uniref:Uncharacterized protein n=1 Tax=Paraburkholderia tropica TaxID=92647 RepID=A0AAQ1JVI1_9BURK|nr:MULTISPECIES: hypothetical protein [Paraburkholderia]MBB3000920.1 hypothetical protein [Paraburkholderia tropica]MBB6319292.1 hypothetical protein [Paraburkholderia tropica]MDE1141746.1 hypothetical protein [Paraburkholderia tropica]PXX16340.1 hypothetical protein C7400_108147 [Paraburkholderia tropica]PZW82732.1 hypothetical protein C7399_108147 [Paraburkholderia tropica]